MILGLVCLAGIILLFRPQGPLPHNAFYNPISAADAISSLRKVPEKDVVFAWSRTFWDVSKLDAVYAAYDSYFEKRRGEIAAILGTPTFDGDWMLDSYPLFAVRDRIVVWGSGDDTLYLRIYHEDKEVGIEVSLLTPRSRNSNHEAESPYEWLRKHAARQK